MPQKEGEQTNEEAISGCIKLLSDGKIVAIKGIGGYHFAFLASEGSAARRLSAFKHREGKAFAVLFPSIEEIKRAANVSRDEEELLASPQRPIVLLERKDINVIADDVFGDSDRLGAMLSSNPLQLLLAKELGPLVMTSGNLGGEPIITDDDEMKALSQMKGIPDAVLFHDREILHGLDDSILQVLETDSRRVVQLIRRARGYVPSPIFLKDISFPSESFAAGGDLKSHFALGKENAVYLSGLFSDLLGDASVAKRKKAITHMEGLLDISPKRFAADLHPGYVSGMESSFPVKPERIQHHHAHILSVCAEHGLSFPVLGLAFDGTGYGTDGTIWGGELLYCKRKSFKRLWHLPSVEMPGADVAARYCKAAAFSWLWAADRDAALEFLGDDRKGELWSAVLSSHIGTVRCSSVGRLFDAAAAVLSLCEENNFEGRAAMKLERAAREFGRKTNIDLSIDASSLMPELYYRRMNGEDTGLLAMLFHETLTDIAIQACQRAREETGCTVLALSGGSMQNKILLKLLIKGLEKRGFSVYLNESVPCNDGGISLGQIYFLGEERCV